MEELYNRQTDAGGWINRAGDPALNPIKEQLAPRRCGIFRPIRDMSILLKRRPSAN